MKPEQLKTYLSEKFELVCFEDLSTFRNKQRTIFDLFKKLRKSVFSDSERLVFYTEHRLEQNFLNHIQRAAARIDIGNFFILIITPYDITIPLSISNQKYGYDTISISSMTLDVTHTLPFGSLNIISDPSTICPLPFMKLDIYPNTTSPCCKFIGNVGDRSYNTLKEIFHGDKLNSIRKEMATGNKPNECQICWDAERKNQTSYRLHAIDKYGDKLDQGWFDECNIRDITTSPATLCNFKCRICSISSSSKIASEEYKFSTTDVQKNSIKKYINLALNTDTIFNDILDNIQTLEYLHIMGGEPFLWPELDKLITGIINTGLANQIQLEFNTNGSIYPEQLIQKFSKFKQVELLLSIDDIGPRFELQRGGVWDEVLSNICKYKDLSNDQFLIKIAPTVNIQNILYLEEIVEFCNAMDLGIVWWFLENPHFLSIDALTQTAKNKVHEKYYNHSVRELAAIADRVYMTPPVSGHLFLEYMNKLDSRRNENSHVILDEIMTAMSKV